MLVIIINGHRLGTHAPGAKEPRAVENQVAHHLLIAHGLGSQAIRSEARAPLVALVHNAPVPEPLFEDEACIDAAREEYTRLNAWLMDPIFRGAYPAEEWGRMGADVPRVEDGDMATIAQPLDWLGLNLYGCHGVVGPEHPCHGYEDHYPKTSMGWPITPSILRWGPRFAHEVHGAANIVITESGAAFPDQVLPWGAVEDTARIEYLRRHLDELERARAEGVPLRGYYLWSLLDNFEWDRGYGQRFGTVHVNRETMVRTPKASFEWYRRWIEDRRW
jgi:beta-glucosidase